MGLLVTFSSHYGPKEISTHSTRTVARRQFINIKSHIDVNIYFAFFFQSRNKVPIKQIIKAKY